MKTGENETCVFRFNGQETECCAILGQRCGSNHTQSISFINHHGAEKGKTVELSIGIREWLIGRAC